MKGNGNHARDVGAGLLDGYAGLEARNSRIVEAAQKLLGAIELQKEQEGGIAVEKAETRGHHANDVARNAVDDDVAANDGVVASESRLPPCIGQNGGLRATWRRVTFRKPAAESGLHTEDRQHLGRNVEALRFLRLGESSDALRIPSV